MAFFTKNKTNSDDIVIGDTVVCPKCGNSYKTNARYCMKCGTLNYHHPDNQYMKKYVSQKKYDKINENYITENLDDNNEAVYVGGKKLKEIQINSNVSVESKNYKAELVYVLLFSILCFGGFRFLLDMDTYICFQLSILILILFVSILSIADIYRKAGYSFFSIFIPIYSSYVLCEMLLNKGILFLIGFIPIVNIGFFLYLLYKLGKKFGINGILSVVLFPIVILYIAFSDRVKFLGIPSDGKNNTIVSVIGFIFLIIFVVVFFSFFKELIIF